MEIRELQEAIHKNAVDHGWWEPQPQQVQFQKTEDMTFTEPREAFAQRSFGDLVALCHSELSEALEAYRTSGATHCWEQQISKTEFKPEGAFVELADCIIRILDMAEYYEIDMQVLIKQKHEYNKSRPYRHGGKNL